MSDTSQDETRGLYEKYEVRDEDGSTVDDCFVLEPTDDPAARAALRTYANVTSDSELRQDLREWINQINASDTDDDDNGGSS